MTEIEEVKNLHRQLAKEYILLLRRKRHVSSFEVKMLESEILECESRLRSLGVDF